MGGRICRKVVEEGCQSFEVRFCSTKIKHIATLAIVFFKTISELKSSAHSVLSHYMLAPNSDGIVCEGSSSASC